MNLISTACSDLETDVKGPKKGLQENPPAKPTKSLHRDIRPFNKLPEADQELDRALVDSLIPTLSKKGYKIVKGKG